MKKIEIFDSTLRDGAQGEGISFSVEDKLAICKELDELGVSFIEAGNPGSNPKDMEFFKRADELQLKRAKLVAFGSTRRKGITAEQDSNVQALLTANTDYVAVFGKCWDIHAYDILRVTEQENYDMIYDTVSFFAGKGKSVIFDAEHFFDGYKANAEFAMKAVETAARAGAKTLALCDTNGGCFPDEIYEITKKVCEEFPDVQVGIHAHNDGGVAVANSVMAVKAGAVQVQGTFLGFGERTGNANLSTIIPNLQLKLGYSLIAQENMQNLTETARTIAEISNIRIKSGEPFVGASAFAHKAGMHADGVLKRSDSFEHIPPETVGNERRFLMSEISGRGAVLKKIAKFAPDIDKDSPEMKQIIDSLKKMEHDGYQYDGAEQSFELMVRKITGKYKPSFELVNYTIISSNPYDENYSSTATVKIKVGGQVQLMASEGLGPVNALDKALRGALKVFYPKVGDSKLIDYKVRVMDSGKATASNVRVLISSTDGKKIWTTVGCSFDIIEASWIALVDSIEYMLTKGK